ncbi:MAG TPA: TetR/AcrR family transcriptional regulator [Nocardioides sp.]|nr:TetR/AcrR family transcriptional regulator [Nocardioides sp.]
MTATTPSAHGRTRLSPDARREQLIELGLELFSGGSLEDISIDRLAEAGGVSRGLLYHYFGSKQGFHEAVVQRAADDLVAQTAPPEGADPVDRLHASMAAYVDYVVAQEEGYRSLVRAAAGGHETLRRIYEGARAVMIDRVFSSDSLGEVIVDTPGSRLAVRSWAALAEEAVLAWCADPAGIERDELVRYVTDALPALIGVVPRP